MRSLNCDPEEFHLPETICHLLKSFNFAVAFFQWTGGKMIEILARLCLGPTRHKMVAGLIYWIFELPTLASASVLRIDTWRPVMWPVVDDLSCLLQSSMFVFFHNQTKCCFHQEPASSLKELFLQNISFPCYLTTQIWQFFVVKLDNVEMIENQDSFREVFPDRFNID
uniref:Uncharacterized protein n=1 Tax=Candidatus Kentrum sp. TC TaxID=2126339 RepID=A0A450ZZ60_9GAMM|nr:MAG: hypothetical protein BECKTC1821F_GA0114240_10293 [Candidatus Kentron sp. TC]